MTNSTNTNDAFVYTYVPCNERNNSYVVPLFSSLENAKAAVQETLRFCVSEGEVISEFYTFYKLPDKWNIWEDEFPTYHDVLRMGKKVATTRVNFSLQEL